MSEIKIGDVVPWPKVPSGALVETSGGGRFILRVGNRRLLAKVPGDDTWGTDTWGPWNDKFATSGTIVALGLTGHETASGLQRLAEVFKVRRLYAAGWRPGMSAEDAARLLAGSS